MASNKEKAGSKRNFDNFDVSERLFPGVKDPGDIYFRPNSQKFVKPHPSYLDEGGPNGTGDIKKFNKGPQTSTVGLYDNLKLGALGSVNDSKVRFKPNSVRLNKRLDIIESFKQQELIYNGGNLQDDTDLSDDNDKANSERFGEEQQLRDDNDGFSFGYESLVDEFSPNSSDKDDLYTLYDNTSVRPLLEDSELYEELDKVEKEQLEPLYDNESERKEEQLEPLYDNDNERETLEDISLYEKVIKEEKERLDPLYDNVSERETLEDVELYENPNKVEKEQLEPLYDNEGERETLEDVELYENLDKVEKEQLEPLYDNEGERTILEDSELYEEPKEKDNGILEPLYDNDSERETLEDIELYENTSVRPLLEDSELYEPQEKEKEKLEPLYDNESTDKEKEDIQLYDNESTNKEEDLGQLYDNDEPAENSDDLGQLYENEPIDKEEDLGQLYENEPTPTKEEKVENIITTGRKADNIGKDLGSVY
jgi:hypothetical protein